MTASPARQMHLTMFYNPTGRMAGSWRREGSNAENLYSLDGPEAAAHRAEAAKFDAIFFADTTVFMAVGPTPHLMGFEPITLMAALSAVTSHIGFIGTASTTFMEPYYLARFFAQLDFLSKGRVGCNFVTSFGGDENFSATLPPTDKRYEQADEYLRLVEELWDGWRDDAVVADRERGVWAELDRIRPANFKGKYFNVQGPLNIPRSPQGWPVIVQAGQSDSGMDFAARNAEIVFAAKTELKDSQDYRADLKARAARAGRPDRVPVVLPGIVPIIGDTETEAWQIANDLADLLDEDAGRFELTKVLQGAKLDDLSLNDTVPADRLPAPETVGTNRWGNASRYANYYYRAVDEKWTVGRLIQERNRSGGHGSIVGTAEQAADRMEAWFTQSACDGFTVSPSYLPEGFDRICDELIPVLQKRGLFRTEYEGSTLREHFGLSRPAGRT